nr:MAG TPA: hypothetical protein [Caudoviricetes sp.]
MNLSKTSLDAHSRALTCSRTREHHANTLTPHPSAYVCNAPTPAPIRERVVKPSTLLRLKTNNTKMEQEHQQHPEIERIALSMQRAAYDYGERIAARQLDVRSLTVNSGNGFELTLTDKRQTTKPKDFHQLIQNSAFVNAVEAFAAQVRELGYDGTEVAVNTLVGVKVTLKM